MDEWYNISTTSRTLILGKIAGNNVGGTIDPNGNKVTFSAGSTIAGTKLTKVGDGKLTIAGTHTYDTLTASGGRTDLASALIGNSGPATINADADVHISVSQILAGLNIGAGAVVSLATSLPPAPALEQAASGATGDFGGNLAEAVPEPGSAMLALGGAGQLFGACRARPRQTGGVRE